MAGITLVTGASGFLGSAVARALVARGEQLRVLVRPSSPRANLVGIAVEVVTGDMTQRDTLDAAFAGVSRFYHVAADYRLWARQPAEIRDNNVKGTANLMDAALKAGVERIVYTSSVATLKLGEGEQSVDETAPLDEAQAIGAYKQGKVAAERLVERLIADRGLPAVIVNPSTPIGPRDIRPTPTGRIILEAAKGRMPAFVETGLNFAHVDDIAAGHLLAFDRGRIGERYILGGQNVGLGAFLGTVARTVGRKPPTIRLPRRPLYPLAWIAEAIAHLTGKEPFLTADGLRLARYKMFFSSAKAERELGYQARPYEQGVIDAVNWFRHAGYL